jgi:hypothetical protein
MLRTRMFTPGFKLFSGIAAFLLGGALLYGISSSLLVEGMTVGERLDEQGIVQTVTGPFSIGWKGPVGNHVGYGVLLGAAGIAAFLACVLIAFRDADPEAEAQVLNVETVPLTRAPAGASFMPIAGAFSLGLIALGWVTNEWLLYAGFALLGATAVVWTVRAWAERATGDAEVNLQIYARIIDPLRVPILGALIIGVGVIGVSRVLLALPDKTLSTIFFGVLSVVFFAGVLVVAFMPRIARPLSRVLLAVTAVGVLVGGVWGIAAGEREIEPHGPGHGSEVEEHSAPASTGPALTGPAGPATTGALR